MNPDVLPTTKFGPKPEYELADLMGKELSLKVDPIALRLFIKAFWAKVSQCAHAIHDDGRKENG